MIQLARLGCVHATCTALAFLFTAEMARAEPWHTDNFDVVNFRLLNADQLTLVSFDNGPGKREWYEDYVDTVLGALPFDVERFGDIMAPISDKPLMDDHLKLTAEIFQEWLFPEPLLMPVVEGPDGVDAYRLYLVQNLVAGAGQYHVPDCLAENRLNVILLDAGEVYEGQALTGFGQMVLSHELFHAVQFSSSLLSQGCRKYPTGWIIEGTAEAVGWDVVRSAAAANLPLNTPHSPPIRVAGGRSYAAPLHLPGSNYDGYRTSSFWRFLAEYTAHRYFGAPQPGPAPGPVHYGYLNSLFDRPADALADRKSARPSSELELVDEWIKAVFPGKSLRELYTLFVAALPYYPKFRSDQWGGSVSDSNWITEVFDQCDLIRLTPEDPVSEPIFFSVEEVAAACWRINVNDFTAGKTTDVIPVIGEVFGDKEELDQLAAGSALITDADTLLANIGTGGLGTPPPVRVQADEKVEATTSKNGEFVTGWIFPFEPKVGGSFVVANVAEKAVETQPIPLATMVFTALNEYATLGPSKFDGSAVADAINTPLEIEMDTYRALVQVGEAVKMEDSFVGTGHSEGLVNPCMLEVTANAESQPGSQFAETFGIKLQTSGPISAGTYPVRPYLQYTKDYSRVFPDRQAVAGAWLRDMPAGRHDLMWETGTLTIDSISPHLVVGRIEGVAHSRELSQTTGNREIVETRTLAANFSVRVRGVLGDYRDMGYPCIKRD